MLLVGAILGIAVGRMLLIPVFGVLLVQALVKRDIISKQDSLAIRLYASSSFV